MVVLDVREDEPSWEDELGPLADIKMKVLRPLPNREFAVVQLNNNPMRSIKIGVYLHAEVNKELLECIKANDNLFTIFSHEMAGIGSSLVCH